MAFSFIIQCNHSDKKAIKTNKKQKQTMKKILINTVQYSPMYKITSRDKDQREKQFSYEKIFRENFFEESF